MRPLLTAIPPIPLPIPFAFHASAGPSFGHSLSSPVSFETALRSGPCHCDQSSPRATGANARQEVNAKTATREVRIADGVFIMCSYSLHAAPLDPLANRLFVLVRSGRVDLAVACLNCIINTSLALGQIAHLEHAEAQNWHLDAIVQFDPWCSFAHGPSKCVVAHFPRIVQNCITRIARPLGRSSKSLVQSSKSKLWKRKSFRSD